MDIETDISDENWKKYRKNWFELAKNIKTKEEFDEFYSVLTNLDHTYNSHAEAMGAISLAAFELSASIFGATGFTASCALWRVIKGTGIFRSNVGLRMVNYDHMLYPQYKDDFEKVIKKDTYENLQSAAKSRLKKAESSGDMAERVREHMKNIAAGNLPWGYVVSDD
jgi:hypothetical protein